MAFKRVSTTAFSKVSRVFWGNRFLIVLPFALGFGAAVVAVVGAAVVVAADSSSWLKYGTATWVIVLIKLKTPSPITAVVKRLLPDSGRPTLALIPAPPKGVFKSTLPLKIKRGNISKDLHEKIDKKSFLCTDFFYQTRSWFG